MNKEYPIRIHDIIETDKVNLLMLHSVERNKNIAIGGFSIADQLSTNSLPDRYSG